MIPNIVKGRGVTGALKYALSEGWAEEKKAPLAHALARANGETEARTYKTLAEGEQSRVEILGGQNFGFEIQDSASLDLARRMMEWNGKAENQASRGRKCEQDCLHMSLSWEIGQTPTADDMREAGRGALKALGMENAMAVFIAHHDTDHPHIHVIASRLDPTTGKTFSQVDDFTKAQTWALGYERQHGLTSSNEARRELQNLSGAVAERNAGAVLDHLTERNPTFTARELDKALSLGGLSAENRAAFRADILTNSQVVGLKDDIDGPTTRYTTRDVLASEMSVVRGADRLAENRIHALTETTVDRMAEQFTLKPEQHQAVEHLTRAEGFAILWGEAGTGKSHTLKAVRSAYEYEGAQVVGLSWTNDVVQQMRGDGFKEAMTISSALHGVEDGRINWDENTVLIVDEAAMLSTKSLGALIVAALDAGAKVILAGDDAQLSSIERGGMFETLRQQHGAAVLEDVQRVQTKEQKAAFNEMHKGEFRNALETFAQAGGVHWSARQDEALTAMAAHYTAAVAESPDKRRFMFAQTNAEVDTLNAHARQLHAARGDLGDSASLQTSRGEAEFATGDRIQFIGNGYGQRQKNMGFTNGRVGTIVDMQFEGDFLKPRLTVKLDTAKDAPEQIVSFSVGDDAKAGEFNQFRHGYAGTIYKGQGRTLDESMVLHSKQLGRSNAYVALTRHRDQVHIFASEETILQMDKRAPFNKYAARLTHDDAGYSQVLHAHGLDVMARGFSRAENKRAATAYEIDLPSTLRIDFADVSHVVQRDPAAQSLRGYDRALAYLVASRQRLEQTRTHEPALAASSKKSGLSFRDSVEELLRSELERSTDRRKAALAELGRLFGREVNEQEGQEFTRDRGGGFSL